MSAKSRLRTRAPASCARSVQKNPHRRLASDASIENGSTVSTGTSREREKTQSVNVAFTMLRTLIPTEPVDRKLSKIETLRLASSYISHLSSQLNSDQPCRAVPENELPDCFSEIVDIENGANQSNTYGDYSESEKTNHQSSMPRAAATAHQNKICTFCLSESKKLKSQLHAVAPRTLESSPYQYQLLMDSATADTMGTMASSTIARSSRHQDHENGNGNRSRYEYFWSEASNIL